MKKFLLLFVSAVACVGMVFSQATTYPLFEHFTQASCGPCAAQNPTFQANILNVYPGQINHVAYHTSWPGTDPMYSENTSENNAMTSYYGVTGVPTMIMDGTNVGGPTNVSGAMVDDAKKNTSPLKIRVIDTDLGGGNHQVDVEVFTTGTVTGTNFRLKAAVVEQDVNYGSPPGTNGETYFPNVFRDMLPNTTGSAFTPAACGSSTSFTYTYSMGGSWDPAEIYVIAWVQNTTTKEVVNSGSSLDPMWYTMGCESGIEDGTASTTNDFDLNFYNTSGVSEQFQITLTHNAPLGWGVDFDVAASTYTSTATVTIGAASSEAITLNVTPDATPAWGEFTFEIESLDNPSDPHEFITYTVVSGITDLIVNNDEGWGNGNSYDWEPDYVSGLTAAGNSTFAATSATQFANAINSGMLADVINVYYNISWTFPSFTDKKADALEAFLDGGGNAFISGQDVGWDTWNNTGTANTQSFYTNYMRATFDDDGSGSDNMLNWNTSDAVFGGETNSSIVNAYTGGTYIYPDHITPISPASSLFTYPSGDTGGLRVSENGHKIVYIGIDTRMISNSSVRDRVIWLSHDWFYGLVSVEELDDYFASALGQNYPNPATESTVIPFTELNQDVTLVITDITGRAIIEQLIPAGTTQYEVTTEALQNGAYQYTIMGTDGGMTTKTMQVIR